MEGFLQQAIDFGQSIGSKVSPVISWASDKIASFVDISSENVHLFILLVGSMYLANILSNKEMGLKFWIITAGLFFTFKFLGF
jgi:phosphoserine phosphatase